MIKRWDSPNTLFYCDPPYPNTDQGHYKGYTQADFDCLIDTLASIKGSFLLSCYPNDAVPAYWERFEFSTQMSAAGGKNIRTSSTARTEVVWRRLNQNHQSNQQQSLAL